LHDFVLILLDLWIEFISNQYIQSRFIGLHIALKLRKHDESCCVAGL